MNLSLHQKNAVVCGITQGIGFASVVELALLGANSTLFARNEVSLKEAVMKLDTSSGQHHDCMSADLMQFAGQKSFTARVRRNKCLIELLKPVTKDYALSK